MSKRAIITGITGQDGSYLAELLLNKGYEVHGLIRRSSSFSTGRIDHLYADPHEHRTRLFLHYADLTDPTSMYSHLHTVKPDEVYNLGAQSHVKVSFETPEYTANADAIGTLRLLGPHLTLENRDKLFSAAAGKSKRDVQRILATMFPLPDVAASIRKLPTPSSDANGPSLLIAAEVVLSISPGVTSMPPIGATGAASIASASFRRP